MEDDRPAEVTEPSGEHPVDARVAQPAVPTVEPTGHPGVDSVLASLEGMEDREVHEHVAMFEQAHGALRRALDDPGHGAGESPTPGD